MDHRITSIQDYIQENTLQRYDAIDVNMYQSNLFHTKMLIKEIDLNNYLFHVKESDLPIEKQKNIKDILRKEMIEIYSGRNIY